MLAKTKVFFEAVGLHFLFSILRLLPLDVASNTGGALARAIGPFFSAQSTARKNLAEFLPEKTLQEREKILRDMWDNLGRVSAELSHVPGNDILPRIKIIGSEYMPNPAKPAFFFSGHFGNWELLPIVSEFCGTPVTIIYREANNKVVDKAIAGIRAVHARNMFPKGRQGAVKMARAIKNNEAIAMLVDQKMNDGIAVPFFGRMAMTAPAIAELALRYDMPIIPARVLRTKGANFEATVYPPLTFEKTGDKEADILAIMTAINSILEGWIREHPAQWFWVHKRWPNVAL